MRCCHFILVVSVCASVLDATSTHAAGAAWVDGPALPLSRSHFSSALVGDRWIVAGGIHYDGSGPLKYPLDVDVFSAKQQAWSTLPPISLGRSYAQMVGDAESGRLLLIGGGTTDINGQFRPRSETDIWDGSHWSVIQLNEARYGHACARAGTRIVCTGGWSTGGGQLGAAEWTDVLEPQWLHAGQMPGGTRIYHSSTTLLGDRYVLTAGGCQPGLSSHSKSADLFDARDVAWRSTGAMNEGRCGHASVRLADGRVLVSGGYAGPKLTSSAEVYDPATELWTTVASMRDARARHIMLALPSGKVLVAGGTSDPIEGDMGTLATVEYYDPAINAWTNGPSLNSSRWFAGGVVVDESVYVAGGYRNAESLSSMERLDVSVESESSSSCDCRIGRTSNAPESSHFTLTVAGLCVSLFLRRKFS